MSIRGRFEALKRGTARDIADGKVDAKIAARPQVVLAAGQQLVDEGDLDRAKVLFQDLVDAGDPRWAVPAASYLGQILERWGDRSGAIAAYRLAVTIDEPRGRAFTAYHLGQLLFDHDAEGARSAFETAVATHDPDFSIASAFKLGTLEQRRGRLDEARRRYTQVVDSSHPTWSGRAAGFMASMLADAGDDAGAEKMMTRAASSEDPMAAATALLWLADRAETSNPSEAERLYRQAVAIDSGDESAEAAYYLGKLRYKHGDRDEARRMFTQAQQAEGPAISGRGMVGLGMLLADEGDSAGASEWYRKALETGDEEVMSSARALLKALIK